jgi:molecular chaperone GrpE
MAKKKGARATKKVKTMQNEVKPEKKVESEPEAAELEPKSELAPEAEDEKDEMAKMKEELAEYKDKYLRAMAEFDNYRRRTIAEKADWIRHATKELALHICDVVDNFERALNQAAGQDLETAFGKGIVLIEKQLVNALEKEGVKKIEALGSEFNPEYHDALAHIPSEYEENIVAAIIQNGYTMHDKVIRPAQVAVSNGNKISTLEE